MACGICSPWRGSTDIPACYKRSQEMTYSSCNFTQIWEQRTLGGKSLMIVSSISAIEMCVVLQIYFMAAKNACCSTVLIFRPSIHGSSACRSFSFSIAGETPVGEAWDMVDARIARGIIKTIYII